MNVLRSLNRIKRSVLKSLTSNFKNKTSELKQDNLDVKRILVSRPNHRLGNLILLSPLIHDLEVTFPNSKIDLLVNQSAASQIYKNYKRVETILEFPRKPFKNFKAYCQVLFQLRKERYDLVVNAVPNSSSGKIFTAFSKADYKFFGGDNLKHHDNAIEEIHIAKQTLYALRPFLEVCGFNVNHEPVSNLDLRLSNEELAQGGRTVDNMVKNTLPTLCLFTNATGEKCYSENWWLKFYAKLQVEFPDANIIEVLPKERTSKIEFKAPTFYTENIRELGAVIANTDIFIGADSGVMHVASASYTPTIGLFSVTNLNMYQPYNQGSCAVNTNCDTINTCFEKIRNIVYPELNTSA